MLYCPVFHKVNPIINAEMIRECVQDLQFPGEDTPLPLAAELKHAPSRPFSIGKILVCIALLAVLLLLCELLPATRPYSPLGAVLPDTWLRQLHQLSGF